MKKHGLRPSRSIDYANCTVDTQWQFAERTLQFRKEWGERHIIVYDNRKGMNTTKPCNLHEIDDNLKALSCNSPELNSDIVSLCRLQLPPESRTVKQRLEPL